MEITQARAEDIAELARLLGVLLSQEAEFEANPEVQQRGLEQIIRNPEVGHILLARSDGKIIGMVNLLYTVSTALGERVAILEDMVVLPEARGRGVGSSLIENAIELAKKSGCRRITVLSDEDNASAHRFYQRHGFHPSTMKVFRNLLDQE